MAVLAGITYPERQPGAVRHLSANCLIIESCQLGVQSIYAKVRRTVFRSDVTHGTPRSLGNAQVYELAGSYPRGRFLQRLCYIRNRPSSLSSPRPQLVCSLGEHFRLSKPWATYLCQYNNNAVRFTKNEQKDIGPKALTHTGPELLDIAKAQTWMAWYSSLHSMDFILSMCCRVLIAWD